MLYFSKPRKKKRKEKKMENKKNTIIREENKKGICTCDGGVACFGSDAHIFIYFCCRKSDLIQRHSEKSKKNVSLLMKERLVSIWVISYRFSLLMKLILVVTRNYFYLICVCSRSLLNSMSVFG